MVYKRKRDDATSSRNAEDDDLDDEDRDAMAAFENEGFDEKLTAEEQDRSKADAHPHSEI